MVSSTKRERSRSAPSAQRNTPALKVVKRKRATSLLEQRRSGFFYGIFGSGEYQHHQPQLLENLLDKLADHMSRFHISMPEDQPEDMTATADQATSGSARIDTPNPDFSSTPASSGKPVAESSHQAALTWEEMNNLPLGDWADEVADNQKAQPPRASSSNSDVKAPAADYEAPEDSIVFQNGADKVADNQKPEVSSPKDAVKPADHLSGASDHSADLQKNEPPQGSPATEIQAQGTAEASDDCTDLLNGQAAGGCPPPEDSAQGAAEISLPSYPPEEEEKKGNLLCCAKHNIQLCSDDLRVQFRRQLLERAIFKAETRSRLSGRRSPYTVPSPSNLCEGKKAWQTQSSTQQASQQPVKEQNPEPLRNDMCDITFNEMDRHRFYKTMLADFEQALADLKATDPSKQPTLHLFEKRDALRKYQLQCLSNNSDRLTGELNYAQELANDWYSRCFEANNQLAHAERRIEACERNAEEAINEWLKLQEEQRANLETARQDRLRHEQDQQTIRQLEERLRYADEDKLRLKELERQHEKDRQDARALAEAHSRKSEEDKRTIARLTEQLRLSQGDNVQIRKSASQSSEEEEKAVEQSVPIVKAH